MAKKSKFVPLDAPLLDEMARGWLQLHGWLLWLRASQKAQRGISVAGHSIIGLSFFKWAFHFFIQTTILPLRLSTLKWRHGPNTYPRHPT